MKKNKVWCNRYELKLLNFVWNFVVGGGYNGHGPCHGLVVTAYTTSAPNLFVQPYGHRRSRYPPHTQRPRVYAAVDLHLSVATCGGRRFMYPVLRSTNAQLHRLVKTFKRYRCWTCPPVYVSRKYLRTHTYAYTHTPMHIYTHTYTRTHT